MYTNYLRPPILRNNISRTKDDRSTNRMQKAYERKAILGMAVAGLSDKENPMSLCGTNYKHVVCF